MKSAPRISTEIIEFLNSLPVTLHLEEWIVEFRQGLQQILGDVDRILIAPNTACDLISPETYRPVLAITQAQGVGQVEWGDVVTSSLEEQRPPSAQVMEDAMKLNFPFHLYHDPNVFEYFYKETAYLGAIFLFREKQQRPVTQETLDLMESLQPFLVFALSDAITRHHYAKPVDRAYYDAIRQMAEDARLTVQDRRIIVNLLLGYSYKETAELLGIKLDTVKKHIKRVHQRTGARSQGELFAMYFTARFGLKMPGDGEED